MPRKLPEGVEKESLTVRVKPDTARTLRVAAALRPPHSRTMGDIVDELVEQHLDPAPPQTTPTKAPAATKVATKKTPKR